MISVALIGLGWHARRIYYPWLERAAHEGSLELSAVVDARSGEAAVRAYLAARSLQPGELLFSPGQERTSGRVAPEVAEALGALRDAGKLDRIVLSTDPAAHKAYLAWALERGVDVLVDKPLTAPAERLGPAGVAELLARDFAQVLAWQRASGARVVVQTQRRMHAGYRWVRETLADVLEEHRVPISLLDVYHADGVSLMPDEWERDYHPYKYGTGKLLHSGYHFVDLASWLLALNAPLRAGPARLELDARAVRPADVLAQNAAAYPALFGPAPPAPDVSGFGEVDLYLLAQVLRAERVETTLSLQLVQNSFSRRATPTPPLDPYKGAGRVRHERLNVQVGSLLNLQVHSYQSHELRDPQPAATYGPGHLDHFDVTVFRNADLIGGPPVRERSFGREAGGHNEAARVALLEAFLEGRPTHSELADHAQSVALLAAAYRALARRAPPGAVVDL